LTMDRISRTQQYETLASIRPWIWSTHWYICWSTLYIIQFKEFPTAFKLMSFDMADLLHFVFEQVGR
jgi:hypothetical protein